MHEVPESRGGLDLGRGAVAPPQDGFWGHDTLMGVRALPALHGSYAHDITKLILHRT